MEKITITNTRNLSLAGYHYKNGEKLVILVHGYASEKTTKGRYTDLAIALTKKDFSVLAFDFAGCGESDDDDITVAKQVDDLQTIVNFAKKLDYKEIAVVGHSLGGLVSAQVHDPVIKTMVWWAPVTAAKSNALDNFDEKQVKEYEDTGKITKNTVSGNRKQVITDGIFVKERESIDQHALISSVKIPVLIIHGDADEMVPLQDSLDASLFENISLEIIPGADHRMNPHLEKTINYTVEWIEQHL
ncbi:MAG: alpha-beta hydrolase superfamily lysophospholipase [Candidatus Woesearchaeota archaeon]|jgi:alpha-beta hydrolase superfamily lysophospholipase